MSEKMVASDVAQAIFRTASAGVSVMGIRYGTSEAAGIFVPIRPRLILHPCRNRNVRVRGHQMNGELLAKSKSTRFKGKIILNKDCYQSHFSGVLFLPTCHIQRLNEL